jgi:hypothetical protein
MDADFPAAHSMDTRWFAIDAEGHIGYFISLEAGAVPKLARGGDSNDDRAFEALDQLTGLAPVGPPRRGEYGMIDPASLGLFVYRHDDRFENWISGPYFRERAPSSALHVDQLPPALRDYVSRMLLDCLTFREESRIQPVELTPCDSWQSEFVTLDGEQKPMPKK